MDLIRFLYIIPAALIAIVFHEFAHGFVSYKLGDPTPKKEGRLSLNPLNHLDPAGTLCLVLFGFGWAKPVRIDSYYYKNKKWGIVLVALAGPLMNFLIAFISALLVGITLKFTPTYYGLIEFLTFLTLINIGLGVFNLLPFPPLDGSKVFAAFLPENIYFKVMKYEVWGSIILLILLSTGLLDGILIMVRTFIWDKMWNVVSLIFNI